MQISIGEDISKMRVEGSALLSVRCLRSAHYLHRSEALFALEKKRLFAVVLFPTIDLKLEGKGNQTYSTRFFYKDHGLGIPVQED